MSLSTALLPRVEATGNIALVGVEPSLVETLRRELDNELAITQLTAPEGLFRRIENGMSVDVVVIGLAVDDAVRLAQRVHTHDKLIPIIVLSAPSSTEVLRRTLMFSPFLGSEVTPWSTEDGNVLPAKLRESVVRRRQRLQHRNTLSKAQIRLEKLPLHRPEAKHYLDRLLDHAPVGVISLDLEGTVITLNRQAQQMLSDQDESLLGQPFTRFFPHNERQRLVDLQRQITEKKVEQCSDVFAFPGHGDTPRFIEITAARLAYRTGQRGQMLILQDVTPRVAAENERKRAEEDLKLHAAVLRRFHVITSSENTPLTDKIDQVLRLGCTQFGLPTGVFSRVNDDSLQVLRSVGDAKVYAVGSRHPTSSTYCGIALSAPEPLAVAHATEEDWRDHPAYRHSQLESYIGTAVQIETNTHGTLCFFGKLPRSKTFTSADRELVKLMARWVTSEFQRERDEARMMKLSGALERTADAIMITDRNRVIEYVNPAFEHLTGYSKAELIGQKTNLLRSGLHDDKFYDEMWQVIGKGEAYRGRLVNRKKDGSLFHEQKTISPLKDETGSITNFISVGHDITDLVEAEARNRAHQEELTHVARLSTLGEMTSGLAHELNQPLCAITTYAQGCLHVIDKPECDPERVRYGLEQVVKQATLAGAIFKRLRNFARKGEIHRVDIDIDHVISEVVEFVTDEAHQKGIRLERKVPPETRAAHADPIQVEQVLLNLVRNAMDAVCGLDEQRRRIFLNVVHSDVDWVTVEIRDNGTGCSPEVLERLFDPFVTSKKEGMGIGLSISHGIIEAHGGSLWLEENSDQGAAFRFTLPAGGEENE